MKNTVSYVSIAMSRDSPVGYSDRQRPSFDSQQGNRFFFNPLHSVKTGTEAHPASYPVGTGGSFAPRNVRGLEADHLPLSSTEVKHDGGIPSRPICFHGIVLI
jgi:hypothetical protein